MPVTEIATITLVPGSDIVDKESGTGKIWQGMCDTVSRQDGFRSCFSGHEHESPDTAQLFVNWDKLESHKSFMESSEYAPMLKSIEPVLAGPPSITHYEFSEPGKLTSALSAPITEVATFYLPEKSSSWDQKMAPFDETLSKHAEGFLGFAHGWSVEDLEHEGFGKGVKGKGYLLVIGWQSLDAHMAFRETDAFKDSIGALRDGPKGVELHHTVFRSE